MKYILTLLLWMILGWYVLVRMQHFDVSNWLTDKVISVQKQGTGVLVLAYLKISPVKKVTTLEVSTTHTLVDDYFQDFKVLDMDTPETLDRMLSQIVIQWRVKVNAVYGYTDEQIGSFIDPAQWWEAQLLYYEIKENNIEKVVVWLGIGNNALVKRVVNVVLQWIHDKLRTQFATNPEYLQKAKENALCKFGEKC